MHGKVLRWEGLMKALKSVNIGLWDGLLHT